jgi:hypothetical protein
LSAPHCRIGRYQPVAIAVEDARLFFDALAGGLICEIFLGVRERGAGSAAQGEHRQTTNHGVDEIHPDLPFGNIFSGVASAAPDRARSCGEFGRFL